VIGNVREIGLWPVAKLLTACVLLATLLSTDPAMALETEPDDGTSLSEQFVRVVTLRDYNTRIVLLGTMLLGASAGIVGVFMLLRRQALVGDVVAHCALPGIALAFIVLEAVSPGSGKSLPGLLAGAMVAGVLGAWATLAVQRLTRIKPDAALAIVLSVFFGLGVALFTIVQSLPTGTAAGLHDFVYGKPASIIAADVKFIALASAVVVLICGMLFKEFALLCFDDGFAASQGWPVGLLDVVLLGLVVGVTVIGLQSVGLLLVVAMLIIPAAAARFWTEQLWLMTLVAGLLGAAGAAVGVLLSALFPKLAAGAVIVLAGAAFFLVSLAFGTRRGVLRRVMVYWQTRRKIGRHDLMRAAYEALESEGETATPLSPTELTGRTLHFDQLLGRRRWTPGRLKRLVATALREGLLRREDGDVLRLTENGAGHAARIVRNHRLWELYLIRYADVAPSHIDRDADRIEHVLNPELVDELEAVLAERTAAVAVPPSPHEIGTADAATETK